MEEVVVPFRKRGWSAVPTAFRIMFSANPAAPKLYLIIPLILFRTVILHQPMMYLLVLLCPTLLLLSYFVQMHIRASVRYPAIETSEEGIRVNILYPIYIPWESIQWIQAQGSWQTPIKAGNPYGTKIKFFIIRLNEGAEVLYEKKPNFFLRFLFQYNHQIFIRALSSFDMPPGIILERLNERLVQEREAMLNAEIYQESAAE